MDKLIQDIRSIAGLSGEDIELFKGYVEPGFVAKGEHFLRIGEVNHHMAYILSGLTMHYQLADGLEIPCDFTRENEWLAYLKSFTTRTPADMGIKALEDTRILKLSATNLQRLSEKVPKVLALRAYYTEQSFIRNSQHANDLAMLDAKERYYKFMRESPESPISTEIRGGAKISRRSIPASASRLSSTTSVSGIHSSFRAASPHPTAAPVAIHPENVGFTPCRLILATLFLS